MWPFLKLSSDRVNEFKSVHSSRQWYDPASIFPESEYGYAEKIDLYNERLTKSCLIIEEIKI